MEIIRASYGELDSQLQFQMLRPSLRSGIPVLGPALFQSCASTSDNCHLRRFYRLLPASPSALTHKFPLRKTLPTTAVFSLPDDAALPGSATKAVSIDPVLAVKKKATEISPDLKGTSIFLVGMNCDMKTSLGKLLADGLRYCYFDSDSLVEEAAGGEFAGKSFKERDEEGFRESETEVLKQLSSMGRLVVSAGNGSVQSATNLGLLRHGLSIWIDVPLHMVGRGPTENGDELLPPEVLTQLAAAYQEMRGGYATADATISLQKVASRLGYDDLDSVTIEDMAVEVLKEIERLLRVNKMMEEAARLF